MSCAQHVIKRGNQHKSKPVNGLQVSYHQSEAVNSGPKHMWHAGGVGGEVGLLLPTSGGPQCLLCKFNIGLSALWDHYIWKKHCTAHTFSTD